MNTYPKIYAVYLGAFTKEWKFAPTGRDYIHRFEAIETKEVIESEHFTQSGSTPRKLYKLLWEGRDETISQRRKRLSKVISNMMPIGTKVKLYLRNGKWYYRHMGQ